MIQFFYDYGLILELFPALFLFTIGLKKKKYYPLRYLLLFGVLVLFCFIRSLLPKDNVYLKIFSYFLLYTCCFFVNYFIFDARFIVVLYCTISGLIAQHVGYVFSDFIRGLLFPYMPEAAANIIYALFVALIYIGLFLLFSFRQDPRDFIKLQKGPVISSTIIIFITCIVVLQFYEFYKSQVIFPFQIIFVVLDLTCCISIYIMQKVSYLSARNTIETELVKSRLSQYESLQNVIEVMNIRIHDLKHQIKEIERNPDISPEITKQLKESIAKYKSFARCGNDVIDTILTEKNIAFEKEDIKFTYHLNGLLFSHFATQDINSIFGNALDNAVEYLMLLPKEERFLTIRSYEVGSLAKISFENSFKGEPSFNKEGLINTTKNNAMFHGFGLKSIRSTINKYGGSMTITVEEGTFKLQLLFPKPNLEEKETEK